MPESFQPDRCARKHQHSRAGTNRAEFLRADLHVGGDQVRVELFGAHHFRFPRFRADARVYKPHQFARNDPRLQLRFLITDNCLRELRDKRARTSRQQAARCSPLLPREFVPHVLPVTKDNHDSQSQHR